jgi:hypothetical protein
MTPALERLAELVRQAEAKTRARKIEGETQHAAEQFRAVELRARRAVEQLRALRPASVRALEQADADEQLLKDLVKKLALYKSSLGSEADAERLIATSQAEIERIRSQTKADLDQISREVEEARRELRTATDHYRQLRRELDRLQPELAVQFTGDDRLLWDAEAHFPGGQLQLLAHEIEVGLGAFAALNKLEQYARLKVWIGRFRFHQASQDRDALVTEELRRYHTRFSINSNGYRGNTNRDISRRSARTSRPTGLPTWRRPRSSWCRRSRPAAALAMPSSPAPASPVTINHPRQLSPRPLPQPRRRRPPRSSPPHPLIPTLRPPHSTA